MCEPASMLNEGLMPPSSSIFLSIEGASKCLTNLPMCLSSKFQDNNIQFNCYCQAQVPGPGPLVSDSISKSIIKKKKGPELTL